MAVWCLLSHLALLLQKVEAVTLLGMSTATAQLLEAFDRFAPEEQRKFSAVIVHRAAQLDYGDVTDEESTASAARMFALLDEEEDAQTR